MQQPCIIWELHPSHGGRSVERQKELEVLNRLFLSKCVSAPEGRTSDDAQLLVITEEEICLNCNIHICRSLLCYPDGSGQGSPGFPGTQLQLD